jgi:proline iminopeptidase
MPPTQAHDALTPGTHEIVFDGVVQRYHVVGAGPVCLVHSGGPGIAWEYMRMPRVEAALTTVYVEPVGTGESGRLPDHPRGYTLDRYCQSLHGIIEHLGIPTVHLLGHSHGSFVALRAGASGSAGRDDPVQQRARRRAGALRRGDPERRGVCP